jgi:UDP-2-acetamido-3-amino-2,3-dideoxy-glucuronate N-acetyltransferase
VLAADVLAAVMVGRRSEPEAGLGRNLIRQQRLAPKPATIVAVTEPPFIHPLALVESDEIGSGTRVWAFAHVMPGARIGADCNICDHTYIEGGVVVGDRVTLKSGVYLWEGLRIEDDVFIGPQATFTNDLRPRSRAPFELLQTTIERGASIGAGAVILPGLVIGAGSMVGAGAVVTRNVPADATVVGNPARVKRTAEGGR